jgi:hypothetical protein
MYFFGLAAVCWPLLYASVANYEIWKRSRSESRELPQQSRHATNLSTLPSSKADGQLRKSTFNKKSLDTISLQNKGWRPALLQESEYNTVLLQQSYVLWLMERHQQRIWSWLNCLHEGQGRLLPYFIIIIQ